MYGETTSDATRNWRSSVLHLGRQLIDAQPPLLLLIFRPVVERKPLHLQLRQLTLAGPNAPTEVLILLSCCQEAGAGDQPLGHELLAGHDSLRQRLQADRIGH